MSLSALLNINKISALKGGHELEFAIKKVNSLDNSKDAPEKYLQAIITRVEKIIVREIKKYNPEDNFLCSKLGLETNNSDITWYIKAISGEQNFIKGYPHFAVSVCSVKEEEVQTAFIFDPIRREEFLASKGKGSDLNNNKIRVSKQLSMDGSLLSHYMKKVNPVSENIKGYMNEIRSKRYISRTSGSMALDLAYIASGRIDAMIATNVSEIESAAGIFIAQEAGALVGNFDGNPKLINKGSFICSTPKCFKSIVQTTKENLI